MQTNQNSFNRSSRVTKKGDGGSSSIQDYNLNPRQRPSPHIDNNASSESDILNLYTLEGQRSITGVFHELRNDTIVEMERGLTKLNPSLVRVDDDADLAISHDSLMEMGQSGLIFQKKAGLLVNKKIRQTQSDYSLFPRAIHHDERIKSSNIIQSNSSIEPNLSLPITATGRTSPTNYWCSEGKEERQHKGGGGNTNGKVGGSVWRRHGCKMFTWLSLWLLAVIAALLFFFWPRGVRMAVKQVSQVDDQPYALSSTLGGLIITVNITNILETVFENDNFAPVYVKNAFVKGRWIMRGGEKPFFGKGIPIGLKVGPRSNRIITIPYSVEFTGNPLIDPLYRDFVQRCTDKDRTQRNILLEYNITTNTNYFGISHSHQLDYNYRVPCPISPAQIGHVLESSGLGPDELYLISPNLKEIIDREI